MSNYITITMLFPVFVLALIFMFFFYYWTAPQQRSLANWAREPQKKMGFPLVCHPMTKGDCLPLLALTLVYAATAFWGLGNTTAPQSWQDFGPSSTVEIAWTQPLSLSKLDWYTGLGTGDYKVEISSDGQAWLTLWTEEDENGSPLSYYWADGTGFAPHSALKQGYGDLFRWKSITPTNPQMLQYLRITGQADKEVLDLGELALTDLDGQPFPTPSAITQDGQSLTTWALFDEQDTIPEGYHYLNSTYFDEIYHARTALEHIEGIYPYEISHPPLGKLILGLGIQLFGMTPFGWRFMGTFFGVLMVPALYLFLKNLFGKTPVALCGTALFAFDFMHLTQTRIATIDTYGVFFILLMYLFLYRYLTQPPGTSFAKGALPLFLSGLAWSLGVSSKWTVIYGGVGLGLLYFIGLYFRHRDWPREGNVAFAPWCAKTIAFSVLCFVILPLTIYTASYLPYAQAKGVDTSPTAILAGAQEAIPAAVALAQGQDVDIPTDSLAGIVLENQHFMFTYHEGVTDTHPYSSRWYQWIVNGRPILYYLDNSQEAETGLKSAFAAFHNPVLAWAGLLAILTLVVEWIARRSGIALFILVGYLSQLVPWMLIGRTTFAYHYFPSALFLAMALGYLFDRLTVVRAAGWKTPVYAMTVGAVALYAAFYPVLTGLAVPTWYTTHFLKWFPSWPL